MKKCSYPHTDTSSLTAVIKWLFAVCLTPLFAIDTDNLSFNSGFDGWADTNAGTLE